MSFAESPVATPDLRAHAARLLMAAAPWAQLGAEDALSLIDAMRPVFAPSGSIVMEEGDHIETDYMALVLEGEVRAESSTGVPGEEVVISIIGPGGLIGEMGVIDGAPRSATCTALTDLKLATLSRHALMGLIERQPIVAARLMLAISAGLSARVRESNRRLRTLSQVTRALQRELNATHAVNQRLLERQGGVAPNR